MAAAHQSFVVNKSRLTKRVIVTMAALLLISVTRHTYAQTSTLEVVPLGIRGGSDESNLSSYAVSVVGENAYVCLDAGTVRAGIEAAIRNGIWTGDPADVLRKNIKGYLLSHPHLDHVSGLILNSPDDSAKPIYGIESSLTVVRDKYFTWQSWANFTNEGDKPTLNKYTYKILTPGTTLRLDGTSMSVTPYELSHVNPYKSTAFLIERNASAVLYLGDTGADRIEKSDNLSKLWQVAATHIRGKKLRAIFIEVSYSNAQPDNLLFGHLTPSLLMEELQKLAALLPAGSLKDFPIVVTHMKPAPGRIEAIMKELSEGNKLQVRLVYPQQGQKLSF
jgi:cAMP phosphodiesterase